jgi:hypothetical protein
MSLLDRIALYVLLAGLAVRPLLSETFQPLEVSFLSALQERGGPTPAATAGLDFLLLVGAAWTLARVGGSRRQSAVAAGIVLLTVAVLVSSRAAGDRPAALLAGSNLVIIGLAGGALVVSRQPALRGLILAVVLATSATTALKCLKQEFSENPLLRQQWETVYRPKLLAQGFDPTDPLLVNFERRMQAGEVYGFLAHPNVAASGLMMWLLVGLGLLAGSSGVARRAGLAVICAALIVALWLTGSRGAQVSAVAGVVLLVALGLRAGWCAARHRRLLTLLGVGYAMVIAAGVVYGTAKGTLPHPSLAFRWQYWTAALAAYQDAPLTGVGRENFDTAYLRHKSPEATEEVKNPHNVWVSLLVELGPLGLLAGGLLTAGALRGALRGPSQATPTAELRARDAWPVIIGVLLLHGVSSGTPTEGVGGLVSWIEDVALPWPLALALALWLVRRAPTVVTPWIGAACAAALVAALVHGLLDFALLTPGGLAVFVLCAAAGHAGTSQPIAPRRRVWSLLGCAAVALHAGVVVWPTTAAMAALDRIEQAARTPGPQGVALLRGELENLSVGDSAVVARAAARAAWQVSQAPGCLVTEQLEWLEQARRAAVQATRANALDGNNRVLLARLHEALAQAHERGGRADNGLGARRSAAETWEVAVARYPTNPRTRISAGRAWFELWRRADEPAAAKAAREHLTTALAIDDTRPPGEVMRLRPAERQAANDYLSRLQPTTAPAGAWRAGNGVAPGPRERRGPPLSRAKRIRIVQLGSQPVENGH